jgi:hypothetical protein
MNKLAVFFFLWMGWACANAQITKQVTLFNGRNLNKWEGDKKLWHVDAEGVVTAGELTVRQEQNDFLSTKRNYKNYTLHLDFKLEGGIGFINAGIQIHSQRSIKPPFNEMIGYQVDMGNGYWASIYDESRRDRTIASADQEGVKTILHENDWNHYEIRCIGRRIVVLLNGVQTVDYTELENEFPAEGKIALQIHGNGNAKVSFKNIFLQKAEKP